MTATHILASGSTNYTAIGGLTVHGVQLGYFPNGPSGHGAVGVYVDTLPKALLAGLACLLVLVPFS
jgi:hypothetical protein